MDEPSSVADAVVSKDERTWAMIAHLSGFAFYILPGIGQILGPLVVWLAKRDGNPFVNEQAKEALNFQISITIYAIIAAPFILVFIGIPMLAGIHIFQVICMIIGAIKANDGIAFRYPATIRFIK